MAQRRGRLLVLVGSVVAAAGAVAAVSAETNGFAHVTSGFALYGLTVAFSYGMSGWAWWALLPTLGDRSPADRGTTVALVVAAVANGVLAVGWVGQSSVTIHVERTFRHRSLWWFFQLSEPTFGWAVLTVGLLVAGWGFWRAARSVARNHAAGPADANASADVAGPMPGPASAAASGVRALIVLGFGLAASGDVVLDGNRLWSYSGSRGLFAYDVALVLGSLLFGIVWWLLVPRLPATTGSPVRVAGLALAVGYGVLAAGNIALLRGPGSSTTADIVGLVICGAGCAATAGGFWRLSRRRGRMSEPTLMVVAPHGV